MIQIRRPWTRQPQTPTKLSTTGIGAKCFWAINPAVGLAVTRNGTFYKLSVTGAKKVPSRAGFGFGFGSTYGTATSDRVTAADFSPPTGGISVFARYYVASGASASGRIFEFSGINWVSQCGGDSGRNTTSGSYQYATPTGIGTTGITRSVGFVFPEPAAAPYAFIEGASVSNTASANGIAPSVSASGTIYLGNRAALDRSFSGVLYELSFFDSVLSPGEFLALHNNGNLIYEPQRTYVPMSAASSGLPTLTALTASNITTSGYRATVAGS